MTPTEHRARKLGPVHDEALPDLATALDPERAGAWHASRCLGAAGGVARRRDTKYAPGERLVVAHELRRGTAIDWVRAEATPDGLGYRLATEDPALPMLAGLLDADAVAARCEPLVGRVRACRPTALRYKPGARCVVRIDLETEGGAEALFAKCMAAGAGEAAAMLTDLAAIEGPGLPRIAAPVAYWGDLATIVQRAVDGDELHTLVFDPQAPLERRAAAIAAAGAGLAGLHTGARVRAPVRTLADDIDELAGYTAPIAQADADRASRYDALLDRLRTAGEDAASVPSHGALRTDAFLWSAGEVVLIDLDGFCWSEPSRDLGNLLAYLDWRGLRRPEEAGALAVLSPAFLDGYTSVRPLPPTERLDRCRAASLLKIAGRRYRSLHAREWPLVGGLLEQAAVLLR